ncbi:MAG: ATP-binding protein [Anaerolineaceae bacterium]|nr:ATP-binding protein [Anaerolineaceae bacterium]
MVNTADKEVEKNISNNTDSFSERFVLKIPAEIEKLDDVLLFVDTQLESVDCPLKTQMQLDVVVEELFVNIAHYAYEGKSGDAIISMLFNKETSEVEIEFKDSGIAFDPLAKADPDVTLSAEDRQIGGLGIFMVKKNVDFIDYRRENDQNILVIRKKM